MANRTYTVLIVPERSSQVRRIKIPRRLLIQLTLVTLSVVALAGFMGVHYFHIVEQASENRTLKDENVELKARLRVVQEEIARIDGTLQRIDQLAVKIQTITQLNDPERNLAIGPLSEDPNAKTPRVLYAPGERIDYEDEVMDSKLALRMIESQADNAQEGLRREEQKLRDLTDYFTEFPSLLGTTPSIRPTKSKWLNSAFGPRNDPYTNHEVMHKGVDFAADHGSQIIAPADGVVVFVGNRGGYGKTVVVDHGYGMQTHYAHLSSYSVEIAQRVKRGQVIAAVGNTGRSTGAHLHYEVRLSGVPQDPEKYILE